MPVQGMLANVLLSMGVSLGLAMLFAVFLVFRPSPWYDVRIMLPSIALLLSNAVNGISLGLTTALRELTEGKTSCFTTLVASIYLCRAIARPQTVSHNPDSLCTLHRAMMPCMSFC